MFKEFKISDIFYKVETPKIKAKAKDFPTEPSSEYCVPLLTSGTSNQGLTRFAKISDCPMILNNAISISANGNNAGTCFYQSDDFAVLQDAYAVKVNNHEIDSIEEGLYLTAVLNKSLNTTYNWNNKATWNRIIDEKIELPVVMSTNANHKYTVEDLDWNHMKKRIAELERERIAELEAYLKVARLKNYEIIGNS